MVGQAFAPDLLRAAALAHGVDQLNAIRVDDPEHGRGGQERARPILMGFEETKEPGALGKPRKQRPIVARQPAIEGAVAHALEGMQQPQSDHLTGPEVRLRMFGDGAQLLIDFIEQRGDKLHGPHTALLSWPGRHATSMEEAYDDCKPQKLVLLVSKVLYIIWFCRD